MDDPFGTVRIFDKLERHAPDALLAVIGMHRADPRSDKIDLGVGVYRDELGTTPVMKAVKDAEARLLATQSTKAYLGAEGNQRFTDLLAEVALGERAGDPRMTGIQTPGGTGALRLAAELIARTDCRPNVRIGTPTWPNHVPIFRAAGLAVRPHRYYDSEKGDIDLEAFLAGLEDAASGDIVLLHGCGHNPTGTAFTTEQWLDISRLMLRKRLVPLIDLAYQGLGRDLDADGYGARLMLATMPETMIAYSCDKNFGLYRERVGALWVMAETPAVAVPVRETMLVLARSLWSMPPDHGAAAVRLILEDAQLTSVWKAELADMCNRINELRKAIGQAHSRLAPIGRQQGLFALLPISSKTVSCLRSEHGIYMPDSGRINVAGLNNDNITRFISCVVQFISQNP